MRIKNFIKIQLTIFLAVAGISLSAQRFDSLLFKLDAVYPQEKIYCQFDKTIYNPGETIWFKAYLFAGNNLSQVSKTLYADLLDNKGKLLERQTAPLIESSAAASFKLPENIATQVVFVKVYTRWMLNFDSAFLFIKAIPIIITKKAAGKLIHSVPHVSLQFFPEGGDLVEGVESRLAFKAADTKGIPSNVSGDVYDSKQKKVASFSAQH
nr:hypothetical protein [Chitinophagaceae bacterium]